MRKQPAYSVTRVIHFCYGHRILGHKGKCRHLHGHNGVIEITLRRKRLDRLGMVEDFGRIKSSIAAWVKKKLDHKMLLHRRDPLAALLRREGEPVVLMKDNPTAEHIASLVYERARACGLPVICVRLRESRDSCAQYPAS